MPTKIAVAGATGNLGLRIVKALMRIDADVVALVRKDTSEDKIKAQRAAGDRLEIVDFSNREETAGKMDGVRCVVSALQGLRESIVETQSRLLEAATLAAITRFIPSDFATDFRELRAGENRNFDLRREFHKILDRAPIRATSVFNGAFAEILTYGTPLLNLKERSVGYWEDPEWRIDFTSMDDTAAYTAAAALDNDTPRALHISSFSVSPKEIAETAGKILGAPFTVKRMGSLEDLRNQNQRDRAAHPEGEHELYAAWQQGQYLQSMFSTHHSKLDNDRYPSLRWTSLEQALRGERSTEAQKAST